jgi:coenzyme Q-binding protein COQ10
VPQHRETRFLPYTPEQMFAVVADVEHYPEFLPWCARLTVRKREKKDSVEFVTAEMVVAFPPFRERYVSEVKLDETARVIAARHVEGPFRTLDTLWRFEPADGGARVHFFIDFAFRSMLLNAAAGVAFGAAAHRMADAFARRAQALYGPSQDLQKKL